MEDSSTGEEEEELHVLDGSVLEGGGQILRNSISYSALLKKPLRITTIRAGRSPPGLRMQHLKGIETVRELCRGTLVGGEVSSTDMRFVPGELLASGMDLRVDIQTAGSITLLIQTMLPVLLFQPQNRLSESSMSSSLTLLGGTNATHAPQIDYFIHVFLPVAERMFGIGRVAAKVVQRGYYPKGGGNVRLQVTPLSAGDSLTAIDLTVRGEVTRIRGYIFVGGVLPLTMAWEMHKQAVRNLELAGFGKERFPSLEQDLRVVREAKAVGGGSGVLLWAETERGCIIAGSALGDRTKKSKSVATEATSQLIENLTSGGCVDEFLQDQLVILMVLAKGRSRIMTGPITLHTETAIYVARELTGVVVEVERLDDGRCILQCQGLGFSSSAAPISSQELPT